MNEHASTECSVEVEVDFDVIVEELTPESVESPNEHDGEGESEEAAVLEVVAEVVEYSADDCKSDPKGCASSVGEVVEACHVNEMEDGVEASIEGLNSSQ